MAEYIVDMYAEHDGVRCEPIVRCRDCFWFNDYHGKCHRPALVITDEGVFESGDGNYLSVTEAEPNGFCKWGRRGA